MNGLALYSGIAGIELGLKIAVPGYRTVCYVERELPVAAMVVEKMGEKALDEAVVWDDAETFDGTAWRGKVDIISAGFPCQPVSVAGKRKGHKDRRWQWPTVRRIVCEVRPGFVFLENVPGIKPYIPGITADLTEIGYRWTYGFLSAAGCGAPHRRVRWFLLAYAEGERTESIQFTRQRHSPQSSGETLADTDDNESAQSERSKPNIGGRLGNTSQDVPDTIGKGLPIRESFTRDDEKECQTIERSDWWAVEPDVGRGAHGVPDRVDRLRALGNAVVPIVAATAWRILLARLFEAGMIDV